ncbi:hypothetical protein D3C76_1552080 [compost metagenome]
MGIFISHGGTLVGFVHDFPGFPHNVLNASCTFIHRRRHLIHGCRNAANGYAQLAGGLVELTHQLLNGAGVLMILLAYLGQLLVIGQYILVDEAKHCLGMGLHLDNGRIHRIHNILDASGGLA